MKKNIVNILVLISLILVGCSAPNEKANVQMKDDSISTNTIEEQPSSIEKDELNPWQNIDTSIYTKKEYENVTPILPNEFYEKIENKETFVLYIGKTTCQWCGIVYPLIDEVNSQNIPIYYLNTSYFGDAYPIEENEIYAEVKKQHDEIKELLKYSSVPNFRYIENGKLVYGIRNPIPSNYFDENQTSETKKELEQIGIDTMNSFFENIKNGLSNIPNDKIKEWEEFLQELVEKNSNIESTNTISSNLTTNEISKEDLWKLEKEYGIRLAPTGEESYWDMVEELPPNE